MTIRSSVTLALGRYPDKKFEIGNPPAISPL